MINFVDAGRNKVT